MITSELNKPQIPTQTILKGSNLESVSYTNFLLTSLSFGYFLGISPFRIIDKGTGGTGDRTNIHKRRMQQGLCGIVHTFTLLGLALRLCEYRERTFGTNPVDYLSLLRDITTFLYFVNAILLLWTSAEQLQNILEYLIPTMGESHWRPIGKLSKISSGQAVKGFYGISFAMMFFSTFWFVSRLFTVATICPSLPGIPESSSVIGSSERATSSKANDSNTSKLSSIAIIVCSYDILLMIPETVVGIYVDMMMLMGSLTLWAPSVRFSQLLKQNSKTAFDTTVYVGYSNIQVYKELKTLSDLVNDAFQRTILFYTMDALLYNSISLMDAVTGDWFGRGNRIYVMTVLGFVFYTAADANRQVDSMRRWLVDSDNRKPIDSDVLMLLMQEVTNCNPIGLTGNGMFAMNFSFIFSACSFILTIFTLCIQFQRN